MGEGTFIAYFLPRDEGANEYPEAQGGSGHMDHLAIDVEPEMLDEAMTRLDAEGVEYDAAERGYERSIYFKDPNGVTIELLAWHTSPPAGISLAEILKRAQARREGRGAEIVEDEDVRAAIAELGGS